MGALRGQAYVDAAGGQQPETAFAAFGQPAFGLILVAKLLIKACAAASQPTVGSGHTHGAGAAIVAVGIGGKWCWKTHIPKDRFSGRLPDKTRKKKSLSFLIGPPNAPPYAFVLITGGLFGLRLGSFAVLEEPVIGVQ